LSDSAENLKKFRIPDNTQVAPHSYYVFYEYQFNAAGGSSIPFTFNSAHGGRVYISAADAAGELTGYRLAVDFGPAARGISFERHTNSIGEVDFTAAQSPTFGISNPTSVAQFRSGTGAINSAPLVGPVVIDEIMASPAQLPSGERGFEFLELRNGSVTAVPLFDPNAPTNTWKIKGGIDFTFPPGVTLGPGETLLVASFNPVIDVGALADFRSRYQVPAQTAIYGPYQGQLENNGEDIELRCPDDPQLFPHPDAGFVPYVAVDYIHYRTAAPWPNGADGTGASLQRSDLLAYGNEPLNWTVALPTAGRPNSANPDDVNADGLPDSWQTAYFGSISSPDAAPGMDPDFDDFNNMQEFVAGTNPTQASSRLEIRSVIPVAGGLQISFLGVTGKSYSLLWSDNCAPGTWHKVVDVPARPGTGDVILVDTGAGTGPRFYRVSTPQIP
jgi:hypothetical protein